MGLLCPDFCGRPDVYWQLWIVFYSVPFVLSVPANGSHGRSEVGTSGGRRFSLIRIRKMGLRVLSAGLEIGRTPAFEFNLQADKLRS